MPTRVRYARSIARIVVTAAQTISRNVNGERSDIHTPLLRTLSTRTARGYTSPHATTALFALPRWRGCLGPGPTHFLLSEGAGHALSRSDEAADTARRPEGETLWK